MGRGIISCRGRGRGGCCGKGVGGGNRRYGKDGRMDVLSALMNDIVADEQHECNFRSISRGIRLPLNVKVSRLVHSCKMFCKLIQNHA